MGLSTYVGSFNLDSTKLATETQAITSVGFQPKVVLFWWGGNTNSSDNCGSGDYSRGFGAAVSSSERACSGGFSDDAVASSDVARTNRTDSVICVNDDTGDFVNHIVDFVSMDASGFTLVYDATVPSNIRIHFLAIGGTDLTDYKIGSFTNSASTGNFSINTVGFMPEALIIFSTLAADLATSTHDQLAIGWATGASAQGLIATRSRDAVATMDTLGYGYDGECIGQIQSTSSGCIGRGSFVSFDASGFTINCLEAQASTWFYVALKGGSYLVGDLLTQTDTTTDITETTGFQPNAILFNSAVRAKSTQDTPSANNSWSFGGYDGTRQVAAATWDENGTADSEVATAVEHDNVYINISSSDAVQGLMKVISRSSTGFICEMSDDADPSQNFVTYLAMGDSGLASASISPSASESPSASKSPSSSVSPSTSPSMSPSVSPSVSPSTSPSKSPSASASPSGIIQSASVSPSVSPSTSPSVSPSVSPSTSPSVSPSKSPSKSTSPSTSPSSSVSPSTSPSKSPSSSVSPSASPSKSPSSSVSPSYSPSPSKSPSASASPSASTSPSVVPATCTVTVLNTYPIGTVQAKYYVRLKDPYGTPIAWFNSFESANAQRKLNDIGSFSVEFLDNGDPRYDLFYLDGQIEIYRSIPDIGLGWYVEFEGLIRKWGYATNEGGRKTIAISGPDYNELLSRKVVAYKAGTVRADKNCPAERAMKEYVEENCGPTADDTVVGRLYQGGLPGFSVDPSFDNGETWVGSKSFENVLDICKDISATSDIDFVVIGTGNGKFLFKTGYKQLGRNRTTEGIKMSGQENIYGNVPCVFSIDTGNVKSAQYEVDRQKEANVAIIPGKGDGSTRHSVSVWDDELIDDSPLNIREISRTASSYNEDMETYSLTQSGYEALGENKPVTTVSFAPIQRIGTIYGYDYWFGDVVTVRHRGIDSYKKVSEVSLKIQGFEEELTMGFVDYG